MVISILLFQLTSKQDYSDLLNLIDIYLMPVFNPDGYNFTWANEDDAHRYWRMNRSGPRSGCYGVDLNRNWDYEWMGKNNPLPSAAPTPSW